MALAYTNELEAMPATGQLLLGTLRKILTEDLDMRKVCAKIVPKELTEEQKQKSNNFPRPFGEARCHFGLCHHR
jgi:hypothetical protein